MDGTKGLYYNYPATDLFPSFANNSTAWFDYIHSHGLKTFFNDHPYPVGGNQTQPAEISFRYSGTAFITFYYYHLVAFIQGPMARSGSASASGSLSGDDENSSL